MSHDEVTRLFGPPDEWDDATGVRNCLWGDDKRSVNLSFVWGKALLLSSGNLQ